MPRPPKSNGTSVVSVVQWNRRLQDMVSALVDDEEEQRFVRAQATIRRFWAYRFQRLMTKKLVANMVTKGFNVARIKAMEFEELVPFLKSKELVGVVKKALQRLHQTSVLLGAEVVENDETVINVRVFLAAYLVTLHPTRVFEAPEYPREQAVIVAAEKMLETWERLVGSVQWRGMVEQSDAAVFAGQVVFIMDYFRKFRAWKVPDEQRLVLRIKHALRALYGAYGQLPASEAQDSVLRREIVAQVERLRGKLKQISGEAAMLAFDAECNRSAEFGAVGALIESVAVMHEDVTGVQIIRPPRLTNEELAHELLIDPRFQLSKRAALRSTTQVGIEEIMANAFWESLIDDMALSPPHLKRVFTLVSEIRDALVSVTSPAQHAALHEAMDVDFLREQVAAGAFSWADTAALVDKMGALVVSHAAPARRQALADQQRELFVTSAVASMTLGTPASQREAAVAVCGMLRFQLDAVRVITTDLANTRLRDIAPVVAAHGVEYEQRKIRDKLASGALVFTATKVWLQQAMALVPGTQSLHNHGTFVRVHNEAMMLLVAPHPNAEPLALPESLAMDVRRIEAARAEFKYLVGAAAAVSIVESRGTSDATFARRVALALAEAPCTAQVDMIVVNQLSGVDAPELRVSLAVLVAMVRAVAAEGYMDQVAKLTRVRLYQVYMGLLGSGTLPSLSPHSALGALLPRIEASAAQLHRLARVNRDVYLGFYLDIVG